MMTENPLLTEDPPSPIKRHVKWKMARTNRYGKMTSEAARQIADKLSVPTSIWITTISILDQMSHGVLHMSYPNFVQGPSVVGMRPLFDHFEVLGTHRQAIRKVP